MDRGVDYNIEFHCIVRVILAPNHYSSNGPLVLYQSGADRTHPHRSASPRVANANQYQGSIPKRTSMLQYLYMQATVTLHIDETDNISRGVESCIVRLGTTSIFFPSNGKKLRALRDQLTAQIEEIEGAK